MICFFSLCVHTGTLAHRTDICSVVGSFSLNRSVELVCILFFLYSSLVAFFGRNTNCTWGEKWKLNESWANGIPCAHTRRTKSYSSLMQPVRLAVNWVEVLLACKRSSWDQANATHQCKLTPISLDSIPIRKSLNHSRIFDCVCTKIWTNCFSKTKTNATLFLIQIMPAENIYIHYTMVCTYNDNDNEQYHNEWKKASDPSYNSLIFILPFFLLRLQ